MECLDDYTSLLLHVISHYIIILSIESKLKVCAREKNPFELFDFQCKQFIFQCIKLQTCYVFNTGVFYVNFRFTILKETQLNSHVSEHRKKMLVLK